MPAQRQDGSPFTLLAVICQTTVSKSVKKWTFLGKAQDCILNFHSYKKTLSCKWLRISFSEVELWSFSLSRLVLKIGATVQGIWPLTWSRSTSPLHPPTSLLSCAALRRWSSTPVCQIWTSWDTKQKTFLHTSVLINCKTSLFSATIQPLNQQSLCERCRWSNTIQNHYVYLYALHYAFVIFDG